MKDALYYGDNLEVLREHVATESVDLVYLDPPFNSNRNYNVIFAREAHQAADAAQIHAFEDTWHWTPETDKQYFAAIGGSVPPEVGEALHAMHSLLGENDAMAYLVNMAPRLVELHRVLKPIGSIYLHCDPTMSHYLKALMDSVFGPTRFLNEVTWKRTFSHGNVGRNFGRVTDTLLVYTKTDAYTWNQVFTPYSEGYVRKFFRYTDEQGRRYRTVSLRNPSNRPNLKYAFTASNGVTYQPHPNGWAVAEPRLRLYDEQNRLHFPAKTTGALMLRQYLDDKEGVKLQNLWDDIGPIGAHAAERLGYPTQKPIALLERIISASSNPGDLVLDPFCGCGTTVDASARLKRQWIGIDITYLAVDLIIKRLEHTYGADFAKTFEVRGIPRDEEGAKALFLRDHNEFERWAVSLVDGTPKGQAGDKGVDGIVRFFIDAKNATGKVIVSVKGGDQLNPAFVRDLIGTIESQKAELGVLITRLPPTNGMKDAADHAGSYTWPVNSQKFRRSSSSLSASCLPAGAPTCLRLSPRTSRLPHMRRNRPSSNSTPRPNRARALRPTRG